MSEDGALERLCNQCFLAGMKITQRAMAVMVAEALVSAELCGTCMEYVKGAIDNVSSERWNELLDESREWWEKGCPEEEIE